MVHGRPADRSMQSWFNTTVCATAQTCCAADDGLLIVSSGARHDSEPSLNDFCHHHHHHNDHRRHHHRIIVVHVSVICVIWASRQTISHTPPCFRHYLTISLKPGHHSTGFCVRSLCCCIQHVECSSNMAALVLWRVKGCLIYCSAR